MTSPASSTVLDREIDPATGKGRVSHIVKQVPGKTPQAWVLEASIEGLEVEALCGHRWVPGRDPKQYPVCQGCLDIYHSKVDPDKGLPEA